MRIAISGGIGSGKSEVLEVAKNMGLATASADEINARLLTSPAYIEKLSREFPFAVKDGKVDKKALSNAVFSDEVALKKLNALAHPAILEQISQIDAENLVVEMPLLYEIGAEKLFDAIVYVKTTRAKRLRFLKVNRGMNSRDARARMRAQASPKTLEKRADVVIFNAYDLDALRQNAREALIYLLSDI